VIFNNHFIAKFTAECSSEEISELGSI